MLSAFRYDWNDARLTVREIKELKGEAGVSIRKGKKIVSFDYSVILSWRCAMMSMEGGEAEVAFCEGNYELPDVCADEEWSDWEVRVSVGEDKDGLADVLR